MSAKVAPEPNSNDGTAATNEDVMTSEGDGTTAKDVVVNRPARVTVTQKRQTGLFEFSNTEAIKLKVRQNKLQPHQYDVKELYHDKGCFQMIARHPYFENATLSVIVLNALWISVDTDGNDADTILTAKALFVAADILFFTYFSLELFIRFMAFNRKRDCLKDGWFVFDSSLVALYAFDPFVIGLITKIQGGSGLNLPTAVLRLFRLARLSRLVRMLRSLPELMIMIKGMFSATASVGYTLGLLMLITYVFAIALRNLTPTAEDYIANCVDDIEPTTNLTAFAIAKEACVTLSEDGDDGAIVINFLSTVPETMHTLIIYGTFLDALANYIVPVKVQSTPCFILSWIYIALASLTVMNMLIGVLCEVIAAVAEEEKESMIVDKVNEKFSLICKDLDKNGDGTLSWDEFLLILDYPEALDALDSVGVDMESMVDLAEDFFNEDGEPVCVTFMEFMEMVLDLRGGQTATVKDIMGLGKRFNKKFMKVKDIMDRIDNHVERCEGKMKRLLA